MSSPRSKSIQRSSTSNAALTELLSQFARILIDTGVSLAQVQQLLQVAYVRAAEESAVLRNKRINQSAIAAMTGLNRTKVRSILRDTATQAQDLDRIGGLVRAWTTDPRFRLRNGKPRSLYIRGRDPSFEKLATRYGGDVTPQALLRELKRLGYVAAANNRVRLLRSNPQLSRGRELTDLCAALAQALEPPYSRASLSSVGVTDAHLLIERLTPKARAIFRRRSEQALHAYMTDLANAAVAASSTQRPDRSRGRKVSKLSVLVIDRH